jgi:hypothetical protein
LRSNGFLGRVFHLKALSFGFWQRFVIGDFCYKIRNIGAEALG